MMKDDSSLPLVSVLMPVRGCRDSLPMAVASVLAQTVPDWELLIVFDDDQAAPGWLVRLRDPRIRRLVNRHRPGRGGARQTGLEAATGEFLAFLDADDWMLPQRLEVQLRRLQADDELAAVSAGMYVLDRQERAAGARRLLRGAGQVQSAPARLYQAPLLSASTMIRMNVARAAGYDVDLTVGEDADFLARALGSGRYLQLHEPLYCYREFASFDVQGLYAGLRADRDRRRRQAHGAGERLAAWGRWAIRRLAYPVALAAIGADGVVARRLRALKAAELEALEQGRAVVAGHRARLLAGER